jgi:hypothetical protein
MIAGRAPVARSKGGTSRSPQTIRKCRSQERRLRSGRLRAVLTPSGCAAPTFMTRCSELFESGEKT